PEVEGIKYSPVRLPAPYHPPTQKGVFAPRLLLPLNSDALDSGGWIFFTIEWGFKTDRIVCLQIKK
ncbi:hypothetical protein J6590_098047, partial [Homalodisca vitripennis]